MTPEREKSLRRFYQREIYVDPSEANMHVHELLDALTEARQQLASEQMHFLNADARMVEAEAHCKELEAERDMAAHQAHLLEDRLFGAELGRAGAEAVLATERTTRQQIVEAINDYLVNEDHDHFSEAKEVREGDDVWFLTPRQISERTLRAALRLATTPDTKEGR